MTYSIALNPTSASSFITFNPTTKIFSITRNANSYQGIYTITVTATNAIQNTRSNSSEFKVEIVGNEAPYLMGYPFYESIYAWHEKVLTFSIDYDAEMDNASLDVVLLSATNTTIV